MSVGEAWIDVTADGSGLPAQVREMCERAGKWAKIEAEVDLDTKGLISEVKALAKTASEAATIEFDARLQASKLLAQARALREAAGGTVEYKAEFAKLTGKAGSLIRQANKQEKIRVQAEIDFAQIDQQIAAQMGKTAFVADVDLDTGPAMRDLAALKASIESITAVRVNTSLDTSEVLTDYAAVKSAIESDTGIRLAINSDFDTATVRAAQDRLEAQLRANPIKIPAQVDLDAAAAARARALTESALGVKPVHIPVDLDFQALRGRIEQGISGLATGGINVPINLDDSQVRTQLAGISAALSDSDAVQVGVKAAPDRASARIAHAELAAAMKREGDLELEVKVDVDRFSLAFAKMRQGARDLGDNILAVGGAFKGLGNIKILNAAVVTMRFAAAQAAIVAGALALAYPAVKALAVALADVALQAGAAAVALGTTVAGGVVAIGVAAGTTAIGVMGLGDAFTNLGKIWDRSNNGAKQTKKEIRATKKEMKEFKETLRGLAPSAQDFVLAINDIHPALVDLQQGVQQALFRDLGTQIKKTAKEDLPLLEAGFTSVAKTLNKMAVGTLTWLRSARGQDAINDIFRISNGLLKDMGSAAGNVGKGLLTLFSGSERSFRTVGGMVDDLALRFRKWSTEMVESGRWDAFLKDGEQALRDIGGLFDGAGTAVGKFWTALRDSGGKNPLTSLSEAVQDWADNLNTDAIAAWVDQAKAQFEVLKQDISTMWDGLVTGLENVDTAVAFFNQIREEIGLIEETGIDWEKVFTGKKGFEGALNEAFTGSIKPNLARSLVELFTSPLIADSVSDGLQRTFESNQIFRDIFGDDVANRLAKAFGDTIPEGIDIDGTTIRINEPRFEFEFDPTDLENALAESGMMEIVEGSMGNRAPGDTQTFVYNVQLEAKIKKDKAFQEKLERAMREASQNPSAPGSAGGFSPSVITMPFVIQPKVVMSWPVFLKQLKEQLIAAGKRPVTPGSMGNYAPNITVTPVPVLDEEEWNRGLQERLNKGLTGGGLGGKAGGTITVTPVLGPMPQVPTLPSIPWPVIPRLEGGLPSLPSLPSIPWPIKPTLSGGLPPMPSLPTINWPIKPTLTGGVPSLAAPPPIIVEVRYGPLPKFPTLPLKWLLIYLKYSPLPKFPTLPKPSVTIGISWGKVPPAPNLPDLHQTIRISRVTSEETAKGIVITDGPQIRTIGEAGPEAVVPLSRTQTLDPGVRALLESVAAARGIGSGSKAAERSGPTVGTLQVIAPTGDPEAVAMAVVNRIAARVG